MAAVTDFSQLSPEQQSAIAKYAAATYGTSPRALSMVQQKLSQDPSYANQQLQRFGYKVGAETGGVNEFNPMAEGMSYDQDIRRSLAVDEPEVKDNPKEEKAEQTVPRGGSKSRTGGGTTAADGSLPVPKARPAGVNPLDTNGTVEDASKNKSAPAQGDDTAALALAAGAAGGGLAAWLVKTKGMDPAAAQRMQADLASKPDLAAKNPTVQEFLRMAGPPNRPQLSDFNAGQTFEGQKRLAQPQEDMGVPPNIVDGEFTEQRALPPGQRAIGGPADPMVDMIMRASQAGPVTGPAPAPAVAGPQVSGGPLLPPPPDGGTPIVPPAPPRAPLPGVAASTDDLVTKSLNSGGGDVQAAMATAKMMFDGGAAGPQVAQRIAGEYGPEVAQQVMQAASQVYPQARMGLPPVTEPVGVEALDAGMRRTIGKAVRP